MANLRVDKITSTETFDKTGSVQFDGSGDYLSTSESGFTNIDSTDAFTIEAFVYFNDLSNYDTIFASSDGSFTSGGFKLEIYQSKLRVQANSFDVVDNNSGLTTLSINQWYHVAFSRTSDGNAYVFLNGVLDYSTHGGTFEVTWPKSVRIGAKADNSEYLDGFVSNLRFCYKKALYTSNFKPPMRELEVVPGTVLLACQSKTDASLEKTGKTITVAGNAVANELTPGILTPVVKSGAGSAITGSVEFTSTTDALVLSAGEDFAYGTGDFTIEAWIQPQGKPNGETKAIFTQSQSGNDYIIFKVDSDKAIKATFGSTTVSGGTVEVGSWHHVAVTRASNTVKIFVNGVASAGTTVSTDFSDTTRNPTIGQYTHAYGNIEYYGFISNFRINKGTALYTDDFIPPTKELKRVPGTVLLCCQDPDNPLTEATGKTITGYGDLEQDPPELVTDGGFSSAANWPSAGADWTISGGVATISSADSGYDFLGTLTSSTTNGLLYELTFNISNWTAGRLELAQSNSGNIGVTVTGNGSYTFRFSYTGTTNGNISLYAYTGSTSSFTLDNVSLKRVSQKRKGSNFTPQVGDDRQITFEGVTKIDTDAYFYLPTGNTESREATGTYNAGTRGVALGGDATSPNPDTIIDYITIASTGDAIDFGDLTISDSLNGDAVADHTRGVCLGGRSNVPTPNSTTNAIQFVTISSTGNSQEFGDLVGMTYGMAGFSDSTRGISAGGGVTPNSTANIDYITISSKGNGQDFGDCVSTLTYRAGFSSPTRGIIAGGGLTPGSGAENNSIEYVTIQTTGNGQDFGDLIRPVWRLGGCSNAVRGVMMEGETPAGDGLKAMSFVTIASMGNAQEFGDATTAGQHSNGTSSSTRGVFMGRQGASPYATLTFIDFVHIMTTANAQDFGDLTIGRQGVNACSNGHGGLG